MSQILTPKMKCSALIAMLRDPGLWPEGFEWDFGDCARCAMGMFLLGFKGREFDKSRQFSEVFLIEKELGIIGCNTNAFLSPSMYNVPSWNLVTPQMVADRLEQIHQELEKENG